MFLQLGTLPAIVISSAEVLRDVLRTHDIIFSNKPVMTATWKLSYCGKDMAASQYNDPWKQMKKVTMLGLLSIRRIKLGRSVRVSEIGTVLEAITRQITGDPCSKSKGFNFSEMMNELTNRIICRIAFGIKNDKNQYQESRLYKLLRETQWLMGGFFVGDYFPWLKWVHIVTGQQRRLQNNFKELDQYYTKVISQHIDDLNSFGNQKDHQDDGDYDLLHTVLQLRDGSGEANVFNDMDYVKGLMTDIFIGGTDALASTLDWTMSELLRHPTSMAKVQHEVRTVADGIRNKLVEESDLPKLHYMKQVIKETLRLRPPAPLIIRASTSSACKLFDYDIPSTTRVYINVQSMGLDAKQWEDPEEFRPERFGDDDSEGYKVGVDFDVLAFGMGRRSCPGINFLTVVLELTLANLLCCFDWSLPEGMEADDLNMEKTIGLTVNRNVPLWLVPLPRAGAADPA